MLWTKQVCRPTTSSAAVRGEANCGERQGPDFDFGTAPTLAQLAERPRPHRDRPEVGHRLRARSRQAGRNPLGIPAGRGGALGGIEWGVAVRRRHRRTSRSPTADSPTPGGLHAVKLATGERVWFTPPPTRSRAARGPRLCNGAQSAAITVIPGVVFSPSSTAASARSRRRTARSSGSSTPIANS